YKRIKRMHEVEPRARGDAVKQREIARVLHAIPSHVRDLLAGWQAAHRAPHDVESSTFAEFLAGREQQLVAETDPEKRPATVERAADRRQQAEAVQVRHRVVKGAVAREDYGLRGVHHPPVLCGD